MSLKGYVEVSLQEMVDEIGEEDVKAILSDFSCPLNKDVEYFLKSRAIEFAKHKITQTQLVFQQFKGTVKLSGYYSLTVKSMFVKDSSLSSSLRKRISKFGVRDLTNKAYMIPAPLIAQLGKNFKDGIDKEITGDELLKMALDKISNAQSIIGGKVVYVECEEHLPLLEFYESNGFVRFDKRRLEKDEEDRVSGRYLIQMLKVMK